MGLKISNATNVKVGDKVKAMMRKYGKHIVIGEVWEVTPQDGLPGIWVSIRVKDGDMNDQYVRFMAKGQFNVMVPLNDILLVY